MQKSVLVDIGNGFEISKSDLNLFNKDPSDLYVEFFQFHPKNVFQQYLYGQFLLKNRRIEELKNYIRELFHEDVITLLRAHLYLEVAEYKFLESVFWIKIEKTAMSNNLFEAERKFLLARYWNKREDFQKAKQMSSEALEHYLNLNIQRKVLFCRFFLIQLSRHTSNLDVSHELTSLLFEAKKCGDRELYHSVLSKLSFSM